MVKGRIVSLTARLQVINTRISISELCAASTWKINNSPKNRYRRQPSVSSLVPPMLPLSLSLLVVSSPVSDHLLSLKINTDIVHRPQASHLSLKFLSSHVLIALRQKLFHVALMSVICSASTLSMICQVDLKLLLTARIESKVCDALQNI